MPRLSTHQSTPLLAFCAMAALAGGQAHADQGHAEHSFPASAAERAQAVQAALGEDIVPGRDGLVEIETETGEELATHGPDFRAYDGSQPGFRPGDPERAPACATDHYQRVIYAHPRGPTPADAGAEIAEIRAIMRRMNFVLNADSIASGGVSADYKVLCDRSGRIRVDTIAVGNLHVAKIIDSVTSALGLVNRQADNTIFLDAPNKGWCGIGTFHRDESPGAGNRNNTGGGYAVIERGCWNTPAPMHENGHNQGAVQYGAPSSTGLGAHCAVDYDAMCYSPDGGDLRQGGTSVRCKDRIHFDCGFDDYFDSAPEPGEYLDTHWNLGSPANRFIRFSQPTGGDQPPAKGVPGLDESAPKLVILQRPSRKVSTSKKRRGVRFKFSAYEQGATYQCRVDRSRWKACSSPKKVRLRRGRHAFRARAIDGAGNRSAVKRIKFRIVRR